MSEDREWVIFLAFMLVLFGVLFGYYLGDTATSCPAPD